MSTSRNSKPVLSALFPANESRSIGHDALLIHEPGEINLFAFTALLAQVDLGSVSIPSLIAALSGGGFSLWYGWYTTSVTIPKIVADFRDEMKTERAFHAAQIDKITASKAAGNQS